MPASASSRWRAAARRQRANSVAAKAVPLLLVLALCSCAAPTAAAAGGGDAGTPPKKQEATYACNAIDKVPAAQQCNFIRGNCPAGEVKTVQQHVLWAAALLLLLVVLEAAAAQLPRRSLLLPACLPAESLVPYAQVYYCYVAPHNVVLRSIYVVGWTAALIGLR